MKFFQDCLAALLAVTDFFTLSPIQRPLQDVQNNPLGKLMHVNDVSEYITFPPPHVPDPEDDDFVCKYPNMPSSIWEDCSTPDNRQCWLRNKHTGQEFNISTDYEKYRPVGTTRTYNLTINRAELNLDGVVMPHGVVYGDGSNTTKKYPGPWIRACWGDTIVVNVYNNITNYNGTTIHWHGIRQLHSMEMDGVNAVTQCPIAPYKSFTYNFTTWQYGTSWYHSHYSLQYADGLVGPMTIYGPSSANWDEAKHPTLFTDWDHQSAFQDYSRNNWAKKGPSAAVMDSILLNGQGNFAGMNGNRRYNHTFMPGKKYLMRLINTAADTSFVFAIDNHTIEVMSADFVPIHPYKTNSVHVGIGQRYHVVVHAPTLEQLELWHPNKTLDQLNFWIRTIPAKDCSGFELGNEPDERQGIIRYDKNSKVIPRTARNSTIDINCRDEPYELLQPMLNWTVGPAFNNWTDHDYLEVGIAPSNNEVPMPMYGDFSHWVLGNTSLWLNFSDPSINHIGEDRHTWDKKAVMVPEGATDDDWIYLLIDESGRKQMPDNRFPIRAAHPLHLHGHDFALLKQSSVDLTEVADWRAEVNKDLNLNNPPRRDVVLLPAAGYVVIAFKSDNPGVWLIHCHIAFHASGGLGLQLLERQKDILKVHRRGFRDQVDQGCAEWKEFYANTTNLWDKHDFDYKYFQDDSGI